MKNILIIHQSAELYGSDKTLLLLLSGIDRTVYFPVVILPSEGILKTELEKLEIKVVIAPVLKIYRKMFTPKNMLSFFRDFNNAFTVVTRLHEQYSFHIVYSNTLAVLLGMFFARKKKIKHIWHVHEIIVHPKPIAKLFPILLRKYADIIVCNSNATKNNLMKRQPHIAEKCFVVYNGLAKPDEKQTNKVTKEDFGFSSKDIIVTLIGRISRLKGHKWLVNSYIQKLKNSNVKILFVGSPVPGQEYYLNDLVQTIGENSLQKNIKILPYTKNLDPVWQITDIAVSPSTEAESFGLVALEAMLAKKPVVASKAGGLKEIVIDKQTGFLVKVNDMEGLANAISGLAKSEDLRINMGTEGYKRAVNEFSIDKYVQGIEALFT